MRRRITRRVRFACYLDDWEKRTLLRIADYHGGWSQSAVVRYLIRKEARTLGLWNPNARSAQEQENPHA